MGVAKLYDLWNGTAGHAIQTRLTQVEVLENRVTGEDGDGTRPASSPP